MDLVQLVHRMKTVNVHDIHKKNIDQKIELKFIPKPEHLIELRIY